ncbi:antichymotrypsin-2 isoform X3 [Agrilus planipennis]|uniref:Antichymotrypsin-2 isoform X3 n=1 Tax=Agrilus planipennis TaxID=224129 RepID=A0A1W4XA13_AGRPL|nr:antichymotrypsin-2 isoform X3 [Agrilus planipennis]
MLFNTVLVVFGRRFYNVLIVRALSFLFLSSLFIHESMSQSAEVTSANSQFANKLFQRLVKDNNENVFFSPISVHTILSLIYQGAKNDTQKALAEVLNVPEAKATADGYKAVMSELNNVDNVTLHIANKIWVKENLKLKNSFQTLAVDNFFAEAEPADFNKPEASAELINQWVEQKTNNKIKELIQKDMINGNTAMVLVNAIYFKGNWAKQFKKHATIKQPFYVSNEETVNVDMMHIESNFRYAEDKDLDAKILELPYTNQDVSMLIILPNKKDGINELQQKIVTKDLTSLSNNLRSIKVNVALPKFKIESTINLVQVLTDLGLGIIFSNDANFEDLLDNSAPLKVSDAIQKAFIEVNEEGSEAAAATGYVVDGICKWLDKKELFIIDHPFIILLLTEVAVLFMGSISKPKSIQKIR